MQRLGHGGELFALEASTGAGLTIDQTVIPNVLLRAAGAPAEPQSLPWTRLGHLGKDRPATKRAACQIDKAGAVLERLAGGGVAA